MFPEIMRDEVFRLETRRLWLRWPMISDCDGTDDPRRQENDVTTRHILQWRAEMEQGLGLHLALTLKNASQSCIGWVHLAETATDRLTLRYRLDAGHHGDGLMTEAVQAAIDALFMLGTSVDIGASPMVLDPGGRRVLERCGFTYIGNGMRGDVLNGGLVACDHFRLDRKTWTSLKGWGLPGLGRVPPLNALPQVPTLPVTNAI